MTLLALGAQLVLLRMGLLPIEATAALRCGSFSSSEAISPVPMRQRQSHWR